MATTTSPKADTPAAAPRLSHTSRAWPIGFLIAVAVIFIAYTWIIPNSAQTTKDFFRAWLSLSSINEAIIWAIFAVGLNIVVGYAGLLDLGYVAFWAIGGYTAAWIMSPFAYQITPAFNHLKINIFGHAPPGQVA